MVPWGIRLAVATLLPLALSFKLQSDGGVLPLTLTTIGKSARAIADLEQVFDRPDEMHRDAMDMISKNLSLPNAIAALEHSALANTPSLKQVTSLLTGKQNLRSSGSLNLGAPGLESAVKLLNGMIYETATKYDAELSKCSDYYSKQCALMDAARGQIAASNFVAATSRALILDASANIAKATASIPAKGLALKQNNAKCKKGIQALNKKLEKVMGDIDIITMILKSTDCDKKFLQTDKLVLLRCKDQCTNKEYVTFNHKTLQQEVNQLESSLSHDLVMQNFADMFAPLDDDAVPVKFVQLAGSEYQNVVSMTNDVEKVDSFAQDDAPAPTQCACENPGHSSFPSCKLSKACTCNGKVRLGYGSKWSSWKDVTGSIQCASSKFGGDPFLGQAKECQCEATPAPPRCACENPGHSTFPDCKLSKACSCNGKVRLGYGNKWSPFKNVNGSVQCASSTFGFDPFPGQAKECQCEASVEKLKFNKPPLPKTKIPSAPPCEDPNGGAPSTLNTKCSLTKSPKCYKLQGKFLQIQGKIADERDELMEDIEKLDESCKETAKTIEASIESDNSNLGSAQTKLAEASEKEAGAGENGRQVGIENEEYAADLKKQMNTCSSNYAGYETELCALKKMRGDLFKKFKPGQVPFFQDCELSKWTPEACTKKCAGGEQKLIRSVMTHAEGGAKCLPLTAKKSCNLGPCPVNCVLQQWSSWNKCSSKCGGGVSQRVRDLTQAPKYGGKPCGSSSESRQCNAGACEKDCVLTEWSKWKQCSKDCDGGTEKRQRMVKEPVIGSGKCADKWDPARLQYKECSMKRCKVTNPAEVMKCSQTLDVVLLLDGTPTSGKDAWSAEAKAANLLVDAFEGDAKFAVIHYTGPRTWSGVSRCTGKSNSKIDMKNDCRINLAHHLNENKGEVKGVINGLEFAPGSKLLSLALMTVTSELALGRKNARAVVVVFVDGQPLSFRKTLLASKAIRKKARLVYVPVAKFAPLKFLKTWASRRWQENLVKVSQAADWAKAETGTHIIANICPNIAPHLQVIK